MEVFRIEAGELLANTYFVKNGNEGIIIDSAGDPGILEAEILKHKVDIKAVLLTHGHFDHADLAKHFQDKGIKIYIHKNDADKLYTNKNLGVYLGFKFAKLNADMLLNGGDELDIAGMHIKVIHTPGHSDGGVCYIIGDAIFTGDTIFKLSYGRTDFYDGSFEKLKESIQKILALDKDYKLYTGHGESSTLQYEKLYNPIFLDSGDETDYND